METMTVFRSRFGRVFSVVTWVVLVAATIPTLVDANTLVRGLPLAALLGFGVWAIFWRPALIVHDKGLHIRNVVTTVDVDWGAIQQVDTKWGLTIYTDRGRVSVWAAPAPGRHTAFRASRREGQHLPESTYLAGTVRPGDLASSESGAAAAFIRREWERRRGASGAVVRRTSVPVLVTLITLIVLATASVVL